jgi:hypothetical protein
VAAVAVAVAAEAAVAAVVEAAEVAVAVAAEEAVAAVAAVAAAEEAGAAEEAEAAVAAVVRDFSTYVKNALALTWDGAYFLTPDRGARTARKCLEKAIQDATASDRAALGICLIREDDARANLALLQESPVQVHAYIRPPAGGEVHWRDFVMPPSERGPAENYVVQIPQSRDNYILLTIANDKGVAELAGGSLDNLRVVQKARKELQGSHAHAPTGLRQELRALISKTTTSPVETPNEQANEAAAADQDGASIQERVRRRPTAWDDAWARHAVVQPMHAAPALKYDPRFQQHVYTDGSVKKRTTKSGESFQKAGSAAVRLVPSEEFRVAHVQAI